MQDFLSFALLALIFALVAAGYYFFTAMLLPVVFIMAAGALITLEIFFVPGFGTIGLAGALIGAYGIYLNTKPDAILLALVPTVLLSFLMVKTLSQTKLFKSFILTSAISADKGFKATSDSAEWLIGKKGVAVTDLNPSGKAEIEGRRYSVLADGQFVANGSEVRVTSNEGNVISVVKI